MKEKLAWVAALALIALGLAIVGEWSSYAPVRARARAEPWREFPDWQGTFVTAGFSVPGPVLKAFAVDPPAPEERKRIFANYLAPNARHRCRRWVGSIGSVASNADGWEVTVNMRTRLSGTAFLTTASAETWQVSRSGETTCVKCGLDKGAGVLFID